MQFQSIGRSCGSWSTVTTYPPAPASCGARAMQSAENPRAVPVSKMTACRSEEHTSELQSLMRISYAVFCLKKKNHRQPIPYSTMTNTQYYSNQIYSSDRQQ